MLNIRLSLLALAVIALSQARADDFDLSWHTVDGGGGYSAGGDFELEGTIGQTDAGPADGAIVGGAFELTGGFWQASTACNCPGDMNGDGNRNGLDISQFVSCVVDGGGCSCADIDGANGVTVDDIAAFADYLLAGATCP
ncbi:MAG: hypothetical protein H6819_01210 [Phycisphaerales bacterium]|nr:hypothetical protein [Phycisphaerales bacterium]MCB9857173.1 hypothetical protein [Phycisphaerales bacterium]